MRIASARIGPTGEAIRIRTNAIRTIRRYPRIAYPGLAGAHEWGPIAILGIYRNYSLINILFYCLSGLWSPSPMMPKPLRRRSRPVADGWLDIRLDDVRVMALGACFWQSGAKETLKTATQGSKILYNIDIIG